MNKAIFLTLTIIVISSLSFADTVTQTWSAVYNDTLNQPDAIADIAVDSSGNVYVTGTCYNMPTDVITIKYNSAGVLQWQKTYDGGNNLFDLACAIAVDSSGNVYITGESTQTSGSACVTLKYNTSGTLQWAKTYKGTKSTGQNQGRFILVDSSGNVYVAGICTNNTTNTDYMTLKYNSSGTLSWDETYNSSGTTNDDTRALVKDQYGNIYVAGTTGTVKYNSSGTREWVVENSICSYSLAVDAFANIYILTTSANTVGVIKYNSFGTKQWSSLYYNISDTIIPSAITVDPSGNSYITGRLINSTAPAILTIKFDSSGVFQWDAFYNDISTSFFGGSIACDQWTGVYITALVDSDLLTIKYDSDGNQKWIMQYDTNLTSDTPTPIVVKSGKVYVASSTYSASTNLNYLTVAYDQHFCEKYRAGDLNKDCKVNFKDFAEFAEYWAECNLYPASDCD